MKQDVPPKRPTDDLEHEQYIDRSIDLVARVRAAKEAAQREMEKFGDISEYEIRKIYGQKTELPYEHDNEREPEFRQSAAKQAPDSNSPAGQVRDEQHAGQASFQFNAAETSRQMNREEE